MANNRDGRQRRRPPEQPTQPQRRQRDPRSAAQMPPQQRPARRPDPRPAAAARRTRRRPVRSGVVLRLAATLLVVAVFLVCVALFFRVNDIQVAGNSLYTAEQVIAAAGIAQGDNLVTIRRGATAAQIMAELPYVESAQVERVLPDTVILTVTESDAVYQVAADDGTSWLMNGSGRMLEQADVTASSYPQILGITAQSPAAGAQITTEQTAGLEAAEAVIALLKETDFLPEIVEINVERPYDIVLWYGTRFEIHLGTTDQLEYKFRYLAAILENDQVSEGGIIDLTLEENNVAGFRPWSSTRDFSAEEPSESAESS